MLAGFIFLASATTNLSATEKLQWTRPSTWQYQIGSIVYSPSMVVVPAIWTTIVPLRDSIDSISLEKLKRARRRRSNGNPRRKPSPRPARDLLPTAERRVRARLKMGQITIIGLNHALRVASPQVATEHPFDKALWINPTSSPSRRIGISESLPQSSPHSAVWNRSSNNLQGRRSESRTAPHRTRPNPKPVMVQQHHTKPMSILGHAGASLIHQKALILLEPPTRPRLRPKRHPSVVPVSLRPP